MNGNEGDPVVASMDELQALAVLRTERCVLSGSIWTSAPSS
jgi:hypothetical protein